MKGGVRLIITKMSALFVAAVVCSAFVLASDTSIAASETMEDAQDAVAAINVGWNLGNTLDSNGTWITGSDPDSYETAWGNITTTKAMIDSVKAEGFNTIRIPVTWSQHIDNSGNIDEDWLARVKTIVDYAYDDGMYVILNTHHDGGEGGSDKVSWLRADNSVYESTKDKYAALWTNIANTFKDYDDHLIFEGYNELIDTNNTWNAPSTGNGAYDAVNGYAQTFVDAVRATGGNNAERNLMLQTYVGSWDSAVLNAFEAPTDSATGHLICSVHVYSPWGFTGTSESVTWTSVHDDFGSSDKSEIDGCITALTAFSQRLGMPLIIGEFGAECKGNDDQIALYVQYLVDKAGAAGIKCIYWDNGDYNDGSEGDGGYAIFDRSAMTWKTNIVDSMMTAAAPYVSESTQSPDSTTESTTESTTASVETQATQESTVASDNSEQVSDDIAPSAEASDNADVSSDVSEPANHVIKDLVPFVIADVVLVVAAVVAIIVYKRK